ncbi:MAG TPA: DUF1569 domain-containing protein [Gemmataceae bacterium]|jgi:hypothetical protein|nr:DUF1569 domain-containing protein [Gemmataceae bacterium]
MPVDTCKVAGRRSLHFNSLADINADLDFLAAKKVHALGNWTPGQIYRHLATSMTIAIDGASFTIPWPMRLLSRLFMKKRLQNKPMPPGFQLPKSAANQLLPAPTDEKEGLEAFRHALKRMQIETKRAPSPFLGELTREECDKVQCRHAELHLSFLVPEEALSPVHSPLERTSILP